MGMEGTEEKPVYTKFKQDNNNKATSMFGIQVAEGWRSWILCTNMYENKADQLLELLKTSNKKWD